MRIGGLEKTTLTDYPGKIACMIYTIGCNFRCPYCHNPELVDETAEEIPLKEIYHFLKARKGLLEGVVITGGEPTVHDDLLVMMHEIKKMGYLIKLDSNGTHPETLRRAIEEHLVDYIAMDIKAPFSKYSATVARPVPINAVRESIELLKENKVPYEFRTTLLKYLISPQDLVEIAQEIKGSSPYYLQRFISNKLLNPQIRQKLSYTEEEYQTLLEKVHPYLKNCALR